MSLELFHHYSHEVFHILVYYSTPSFFELDFDTYPVPDYERKDKSHHSGALAREARSGAPWVTKCGKLPIRENLVIT